MFWAFPNQNGPKQLERFRKTHQSSGHTPATTYPKHNTNGQRTEKLGQFYGGRFLLTLTVLVKHTRYVPVRMSALELKPPFEFEIIEAFHESSV